MASTNAFLTMYNTAQANSVGSTISTGFIPYISTGGKQVYTSTLTTLTFSTVNCSSITATSGLNLSVPTGQGITFQVGGSTIGTVTSSGFPGGGMTGTATVIYNNTSGYYGSGTYSVAGYKYIWIRLVGAGGGGSGAGAGTYSTTSGGASSVTYSANTALNMSCGGGQSASYANNSIGGTATGGNIINSPGGNTNSHTLFTQQGYFPGERGADSVLGIGGSGGNPNGGIVAAAGVYGSGGGSAGQYWAGTPWGSVGMGGASGGYAESIITNPTGSVYITIGQGGSATNSGGAGGNGCCIIIGYN